MIIKELSWTDFKNKIESRNLTIQYDEYSDHYNLYAIELGAILYECSFLKETSDSDDFEDNYKGNANQPLPPLPVGNTGGTSTETFTDENVSMSLTINGESTTLFHTSGFFTGDIYWEGTIDNVNWIALTAVDLRLLDGQLYQFAQNIGDQEHLIFHINTAGCVAVRLLTTAPISGTTTISLRSTSGTSVLSGILSYVYTKSDLRDGNGQALTSTTVDTQQALDVNIVNAIEVDPPVGGATEAKQDTIIGHIDGVETLITSTNTKLDTVNTNLGTIDGRVDDLETLITSTNTKLDTVNTNLGDIKTADQLIDDIVYTDDTSTHSTGSSKGALIMAAATPTDASVSANDIGAVAMTTDRKLHVSVQDALPAGTNAIGKLASNDGVDIGDVDVISLPANATIDINRIAGSAPSVSNPLPVRLTNGTNFYDAIPTMYNYAIASQVHVNSANTVHWDIFNADASVIIRIMSIKQIPNITTAVTGIVFDWQLMRTTSVGTGGSAQTAWLSDLNGTALDSDVTCRSKPSGGAAASTVLQNYSLSSEETNAATIQIASQGGLELVPEPLRPAYGGRGIVLRQNQGIRCVQVTSSAAGNTGWIITFIQE